MRWQSIRTVLNQQCPGWMGVGSIEQLHEERGSLEVHRLHYQLRCLRMWLERHAGPMPSRMDVSFDAPEFDDPKWEVIQRPSLMLR